jgi:hypothetical protein
MAIFCVIPPLNLPPPPPPPPNKYSSPLLLGGGVGVEMEAVYSLKSETSKSDQYRSTCTSIVV